MEFIVTCFAAFGEITNVRERIVCISTGGFMS